MTRHESILNPNAASQRVSFRPSGAKSIIGVDPSTVYRWIKSGGLVSDKIGGTTLILASDFQDFVRRLGGRLIMGLSDMTRGFRNEISKRWCPRRDSNSHTLRRRILNPLRLPFRHSGTGELLSFRRARCKARRQIRGLVQKTCRRRGWSRPCSRLPAIAGAVRKSRG